MIFIYIVHLILMLPEFEMPISHLQSIKYYRFLNFILLSVSGAFYIAIFCLFRYLECLTVFIFHYFSTCVIIIWKNILVVSYLSSGEKLSTKNTSALKKLSMPNMLWLLGFCLSISAFIPFLWIVPPSSMEANSGY